MSCNRRRFLESAACLVGASVVTGRPQTGFGTDRTAHERSLPQPTHAVIPVVGDGKWIWKDPPKNGETGYLEPREFDVSVGIRFLGRGAATDIRASTVAPVSFPEQEVTNFEIETQSCSAAINRINDSAAQLVMSTPRIVAGQIVSANARYRMKLRKDYRGFSRESFSIEQSVNSNSTQSGFAKHYLRSSPGINIRSRELKELLKRLNVSAAHPWDRARLFYQWVWDNIEGIPGRYTSVEKAIKKRRGDCEERATVFIAMCRATGIPARLVWVPSHNWAEIGLYDHGGTPQWIPVHTAAYSWFGWTGAHEVILQKGDRMLVPVRRRSIRLIDDWYQLRGVKPEMQFTATVTPVGSEGMDAGPGARKKLPDGRWRLAGNHPDNSLMRDQ